MVGTTTYGVLVGITGYPTLMDGGFVTAPDIGIFSKEGQWIIENEGVHPDVEVENYPKDVIDGRDPQLEKAVEIVMKDIQARPVLKQPADPVKVNITISNPWRLHRFGQISDLCDVINIMLNNSI